MKFKNDKQGNKDAILAIIFLLHILFLWKKNNYLFIYISLSLSFISLLSNDISTLFRKLWEGISEILGKINTVIFLSILFIFFVLPLSLLTKLFRRKLLMLNSQHIKSSFIERNKEYNSGDFENLW